MEEKEKQVQEKLIGYFFVILQISSITAILITDKFYCLNLFGIVQLSGLVLGLWAIITMRIGNFNIVPNVKKHASIVIRGPYKVIRHPMYTSLWLVFIPLVINYYSLFRLIMVDMLIVDLIIKSIFEEKLLCRKFAEYPNYKRKSKRFIPYIF